MKTSIKELMLFGCSIGLVSGCLMALYRGNDQTQNILNCCIFIMAVVTYAVRNEVLRITSFSLAVGSVSMSICYFAETTVVANAIISLTMFVLTVLVCIYQWVDGGNRETRQV